MLRPENWQLNYASKLVIYRRKEILRSKSYGLARPGVGILKTLCLKISMLLKINRNANCLNIVIKNLSADDFFVTIANKITNRLSSCPDRNLHNIPETLQSVDNRDKQNYFERSLQSGLNRQFKFATKLECNITSTKQYYGARKLNLDTTNAIIKQSRSWASNLTINVETLYGIF